MSRSPVRLRIPVNSFGGIPIYCANSWAVVAPVDAARVRGWSPRLYYTTMPAEDRRICLMQDPIYRHSVSFRTVGYTHVPQLSYYLGTK